MCLIHIYVCIHIHAFISSTVKCQFPQFEHYKFILYTYWIVTSYVNLKIKNLEKASKFFKTHEFPYCIVLCTFLHLKYCYQSAKRRELWSCSWQTPWVCRHLKCSYGSVGSTSHSYSIQHTLCPQQFFPFSGLEHWVRGRWMIEAGPPGIAQRVDRKWRSIPGLWEKRMNEPAVWPLHGWPVQTGCPQLSCFIASTEHLTALRKAHMCWTNGSTIKSTYYSCTAARSGSQ